MRKVASLAFVLTLVAAPASAGDKLLRGPVPDWVKVAEVRPPPPASDDGPPVRVLLDDRQLYLGPDGESEFVETVMQIRSPLGLSAAGAMSLAWSPDTDTLTVHHLRILRGGQVIDVLAKQDFAVIRRETNLERAMLDGVLSATVQPEGVQAGDVIDLAYTRRRSDPVMQGRAEDTLFGRAGGKVDRMRLRAVWDSKREIAWTAGRGLDKPKVTRSGGRTEVTVDMKDVEPAKFVVGAPRRLYPTRDLAFSEFGSWAEVAALLEPHFTKGSELEPNSPLRAEAEKIRAASADPKVRASRALQLVEDQIRYLAVTLDNGGYVPAKADDTWRRRFGDCKAKTVMLLALLRELGIESEAALVDADGGERIAERPPGATAFDHVIVRAVIGGKVYWLDGTRSGDSDIDLLRVPRFGQALPLRPAGSTLIALVQAPLARPDSGIFLRIDASKGLDAPAPVHAELIMGGDMGQYMKLYSSTLPAADRDKQLMKAFSGYPGLEPKSVTIVSDPATGQSKLVMDGIGKMEWLPKSTGPRWLAVATGGLGSAAAFKREPGPGADAPWAVNGHPSWISSTFEVVLPEAGEGFRIEGGNVDRTVAGRAYLRRTKIEKGVATIETQIRTVADEFPNSEAEAAAEALKEMAKVRVGVRAPPYYQPTLADIAAWGAETPKAVEDYIQRGVRYAGANLRDKAIADFDKAVALDPKASFAWANRGNAYFWLGKYDLARADFAKALEIEPRNFVAVQGDGLLAMKERRYGDAAAAYGRAADLLPGNTFALAAQAQALWQLGEGDKALAVLDQALKGEPGDTRVRLLRYSILEARNQRDRALSDVDAAIKDSPDDSQLHLYRGAVLSRMNRRAEADAAFARAIALRPTPEAYLTRYGYRNPKDIDGRLSDLELAGKAGERPYAAARAEVLGDAARYDEALAVIDRALKAKVDDRELGRQRAEILLRAGRTAEAAKAIQRLRAEAAGDAGRLNSLCWLGGTRNHGLEAALADCDAALKLDPDSGAATDSRGLVLLRLNRLADALATYDAAAKLLPNNPETLYGRGLVRLRMGQAAEAEADFAAARAFGPYIDTVFDGWGLRAPQPAAPAKAAAS
ncbi:MAG: tetratricopeptide repeat protein [Phenylobacterium sp.]|uniref:tetratricopeptide repeat protein n=1 Tax=Phenylobacterium sp. TaxID=1871053 RepID=UPI001A5D8BE6|nr:tetratricopeptide repeat protein [Phenylobacterium sp.]MBL8554717.1 tetratricopeptide repeat protein [Phenylobacterium sp.]